MKLPRPSAAPVAAAVSCNLDRYAINTASVSDGSGGTIVVWSGSTGMRAQRLDPSGNQLWDSNGIAVSTGEGDKLSPIAIADGAGGFVMAWTEFRDWERVGVFVQRVSSSGTPMWTANGVAVRSTGTQQLPTISLDGSGGVIVTWYDGFDIYAQRVGAGGSLLWNADGVPVCTAFGEQIAPASVSDGAGGAIITWSDTRGASAAVYAQRLNANGASQWAVDGISIATLTGCPSDPSIIPDGSGGAIVTWADLNGSSTALRAQALTASGTIKWAAGGVLVTTALQHNVAVDAASDGAGGVVIGWSDQVAGFADCSLRAQRLNATGSRQWGSTGVLVSTSGTSLHESSLFAGDGAGGAYFVWKPGVSYTLMAQHLDAVGAAQWGAGSGLTVCEAGGTRHSISTASMHANGVVIAWEDRRSEEEDFYAQRLASDGTAQWTVNGAAVLVDPGVQVNPAGVPDGQGGMYLAWQQKVQGDYDIYLRRYSANGYPLWPPVPVCTASKSQLKPVVAADGTGGVLVSWSDPRGSSGTFVQRFGPDGAPAWAVDGVEVTNWFGPFPYPYMVADGTGGAIFAGISFCCGALASRIDSTGATIWTDFLSGSPGSKQLSGLVPDGVGGAVACWSSSGNIYAQRVGRDGVRAWGPDGVAVTQAPGFQWKPSLTGDGAGGAIVAWSDERSGDEDIYAQRIGGNGSARWLTNGIAIAVSLDYETAPVITADGAGGAFMAWRGGTDSDLIAQRVDSTGTAQWGQPKVLCDAAHLQDVRSVVADGTGGALLAWSDLRDDPVRKIYTQRINGNGAAQWASQGVVAGIHSGGQPVIVPDGIGGALLAWQDGLNSPRDTISLAHHPQPVSVAPANPRTLNLAIRSVIPNPSSGPFSVSVVLPRAGIARLELFGIDGRVMARKTLDLTAGVHDVRLAVASGTSSGVYWVRLSQAGAAVTRRISLVR